MNHLFFQLPISDSQYLYGENSSIHRSVDSHCSDRNSRRHLSNSQQSIHSVQRGVDRHPDHRHRCHGRNDSGQMGSHTGSGDNDFYSSLCSLFGKSLHLCRSTMSRQGIHFKWNTHVIQYFRRLLHNGQIGSTPHNNTYSWIHSIFVL